jgi:REP element-mobilizing transposase RayT
MPRQARIDLPGQVYHVLSRGIERREIFHEPEDYLDFKDRMATWLVKTRTSCLAWCLMPNHFHFLLRRGERPLSELMHRVMTGYAVNFNLRHQRAGHLFQNRYKAILCETEGQLLESAIYIHLNPLRAKLVQDITGLEAYKWCGHLSAVSGFADKLLNREYLLAHFGDSEAAALAQYKLKLAERYFEGESEVQPECEESVSSRESYFSELPNHESRVDTAEVPAITRMDALEEAENITGICRRDILRRTRSRGPAKARAIYCNLAHDKAGAKVVELARELGITESAVSKLILRGREYESLDTANSPIVKNVP